MLYFIECHFNLSNRGIGLSAFFLLVLMVFWFWKFHYLFQHLEQSQIILISSTVLLWALFIKILIISLEIWLIELIVQWSSQSFAAGFFDSSMKIDLFKILWYFTAIIYFIYHFVNLITSSHLRLSVSQWQSQSGFVTLIFLTLDDAVLTPEFSTTDSSLLLCIVGFSCQFSWKSSPM